MDNSDSNDNYNKELVIPQEELIINNEENLTIINSSEENQCYINQIQEPQQHQDILNAGHDISYLMNMGYKNYKSTLLTEFNEPTFSENLTPLFINQSNFISSISIPPVYNFTFHNEYYNNILISSNGWIHFGMLPNYFFNTETNNEEKFKLFRFFGSKLISSVHYKFENNLLYILFTGFIDNKIIYNYNGGFSIHLVIDNKSSIKILYETVYSNVPAPIIIGFCDFDSKSKDNIFLTIDDFIFDGINNIDIEDVLDDKIVFFDNSFYFNATQLKNANYKAIELKNYYNLIDLFNANYSIFELKDAGYSLEELKPFYNISQLKSAGFTINELKNNGFNILLLKSAGFTNNDILNAGFSAIDLKNVGFNICELKDAGFNPTQLKEAGYTLNELKEVGFNAIELKNSGTNMFQLKDIGFTANELFKIGYNADLIYMN